MRPERAPHRALSRFEQLRLARDILRREGECLFSLADQLSLDAFSQAVRCVCQCQGRVVVSGMGKAGLVGRKIAATLASTGTPSHFLHPAEAVHGDLGSLAGGDVLIVLSASGETEEVLRLLPSFRDLQIPIIALTANESSTLARAAQVVLYLGPIAEACPLGLAPSSSTTAMLALGDAIALVVSQMRGFAPQDFARNHPGGSLGRKLTKVEEVMRPLSECRLGVETRTLRQVIVEQSSPGRRTGAIMLVDAQGRLQGIFTDSDLARLVGQTREAEFDQPIARVMTKRPKTINAGEAMESALSILQRHKISELPVIESNGIPIGLVDLTDLIGVSMHATRWNEPADAIETQPLTVHFPEPN